MHQQVPPRGKNWMEKISRSGYFFGAVLIHLVVFLMIATWVIFPAFNPPKDDFTKTYLPLPAAPPPPPPPDQPMQVPTHVINPPTAVIFTTAAPMNFNIPVPDFTPSTTADPVHQKMVTKIVTTPTNSLSSARLSKIMDTEKGWGRDINNIHSSNSDPHNVIAKFPIYLASYANGDWGCNVHFNQGGAIDAGSLPNLAAKINEWSHGNIKAEVVPTPLNIGAPELLDKRPPFIFFTGHKDFVLTDKEIQNLRDYLQVGGAIWGDDTLAGRGSRFDVAFRREMKRVIPDLDKNFEPLPMTHDLFAKSWFPIERVPQGMNYYTEPLEHIDIDGKLAILYTPNDYGDLFTMRILPGDTTVAGIYPTKESPLFTFGTFQWYSKVFFRNYTLDGCLPAQRLGMNIIGYMLVRFDKDLLLAP